MIRSIKHRRAYSILGMLVTMVLIVILFSILMTSMNKAITGEGSAVKGTVRSMQDEFYLASLYKSMFANAGERNGEFLIPSTITRSADIAEDTTANMYSAMVMQNYAPPKQLISGNEYSGYIVEYFNYDFLAYDPARGMHWDTAFQADLHDLSHVSFAHMPLFGDRLDTYWRTTLNSAFPLIGNRGPKDGVHDPTSYTYGRDGAWRGHLVFGDGHVDFVDTFTPGFVTFDVRGERFADNIFFMDDGPKGIDAILSFTKSIANASLELQFD